METRLAERTGRMQHSAIREILKAVNRPGMVSLAGGIPAPASYPVALLEELTVSVIRTYGHRVFQYDRTPGFEPLRHVLAGVVTGRGICAAPDDIFISSGSQGMLDALGKVLIGPGTRVAVEAPTYLGALQAFNPYGPCYVSVACDDDGMIPDALDAVLQDGPVAFVYTVPTFQNPSGRTIPAHRRERIAEIMMKHRALLVEDDPYGMLRYRGEPVSPIASLLPREQAVYCGTLSKVFAAGLRIGFSVVPAYLAPYLETAKEGTDLHTGTLGQALAAEYIAQGHMDAQLPALIGLYAPRLQAMLNAMERYFPADVRYSRPDGGMFVWVEGPSGYDADTAYRYCLERGVAFVPGRHFYPEPGCGTNTMRLNFTNAAPGELHDAVRTIAETF